ncbi:GNAT family N-acetyltransferase [Glycomyces sp. NPDC021274]|uniref:GNAT family N-acetyltransferase n=1 Tax=Glycomyces sp. NPDC021274 TaxID=3155120 RepID=UPI0033C378FE
MDIAEIGPADHARMTEAAGLAATVRAADAPGGQPIIAANYAATIAHPRPGHHVRHYTAAVDDHVIGYLRLDVAPENPRTASGELLVHPGHRGAGHGTALLDHALATCRAEDRSTLTFSTIRALGDDGPQRSSDGTRFLERHGFTLALDLVRRRLPVHTPGDAVETRLWDEALAASRDYEVRSWTGPVPDDLLDDMCRMDAMILAQVPMGDLEMAPEQVDAARLRAKEAVTAAHRMTAVHTVAVHRATGEVAAHTRVDVYDVPDARHGHVLITIVDPAHRGRRLGLLVKLANLRHLREHHPDVTELWTANAASNAPMIAVNERLGFEPVERIGIHRRAVDA